MHPKHLTNKPSVNEEQETYSITIRNCANPYIDLRFEGVPKDKAANICSIAIRAFRKFEVVCEQTGEIAYDRYVTDDWHIHSMDYSDAINAMFRIYNKG